MKTLSKRIFAVVLTLAMTLTLTTWASAADFTDMPDNWAKAPLEAAVENGLLNGSDGLLRPTDYLTRAEMAAILVRAFGTTQSASVSGFSDVKADAWYVTQNAVPGAVFMEIMNGNNDGTFEPGRNISREQAFAVLARALKLEAGSSSVLAQFTDAAQISGWASGEVAAMVAAGYVNGSSGKLNPKGNITRQEFAQVMFNIFGDYISTAGTVTELGGKAVMINVPGVTVKDTTVHGDVIIGEGVGEGDVFFENVTIEGRVVVRGGGVNSIHFINSDSSQVLVSKIAGPVRIVADKASSVAEVAVIGGTDAVTVQGSVAKVAVEGDAPVVVKDATVGTVEVSSTAKVELDNAKVTTVAVNASNASVALTNGAAVATVDVAATAAGSTVTGEQGTTITTVKSDVSVTVAGDVKVNKTEGTGSVTDANGDVIATTPTSPSYPSGGSSGGSSGGNKPSEPTAPEEHTHSYGNPTSVDNKSHKSTCSCGDTKIEAHNWAGENSDTCACGAKKPTETTQTPEGECTGTGAQGGAHNFSSTPDEGSTEATCTKEGVATYTCQNEGCSEKKTVTKPATGHTAGTPVEDVTKPATCTEAGSKTVTVTCTVGTCKAEISKSTVKIPLLGHQMGADTASDKDATCSAKGVTGSKKCTRDGCTYKQAGTATDINPDAHNFDKSKKNGVCTYNSKHTCDHGSTAAGAECSTCGMTVPDDTCENESNHTKLHKGKKCDKCDYVGTVEHTFSNGSCSCGETVTADNCPNNANHNTIESTAKCPTCGSNGTKPVTYTCTVEGCNCTLSQEGTCSTANCTNTGCSNTTCHPTETGDQVDP